MAPYEQLRLEHQLCFAVHRASRAVVRAYGPLLADAGLTYPQYLVMLVLWEADPEARTVGQLGEALDLDSGTLTPLLKRLEADGLVTRRRDPDDERRVLVGLTEAGLRLRRTVAAVPGRLWSSLDLAPEDGLALKRQLEALADTLERGSA